MPGSSRPDRKLVDAASLCSHLVKQGSVYAFLAEHRQKLFPDDMFADLFPSDRGQALVPADVIATVMVLQALEGLSDREACRQLETNISWKVACGLGIGTRPSTDGARVMAQQAAGIKAPAAHLRGGAGGDQHLGRDPTRRDGPSTRPCSRTPSSARTRSASCRARSSG